VRSDDILIREEVRRRYADSALGLREDCCDVTGGTYSADDLSVVPDGAALASLGCGNPTAVAELREGETVLDLGSGGGIDVILSAKRVGSSGFAYGLDMTDEMIELARRNAADAKVENVDFLKGLIEEIPLDDESVDVVISNCVINLSVDKQSVFDEVHRVLRPGGRLGITDIVADDALTREERMERGTWVGCIAGALSVTEYRTGLESAGFIEIVLKPTHDVAEGMSSMIIQARRRAQ